MEDVSSAITYAVVEFVDSARLWGVASGLSDNKTCGKALKRSAIAELKIVDLTGSIDILLPLLEHEDPAVRCFAAVALLCDHRDKAVAALRIVDATARFDISFAAGLNLEVIGEVNRGTGADGPNPFPEEIPTNAERREMLLEHIRNL